ncbi:hypothetical protein ACIRRH_06655 [Kitasatospora sp. NPDC101235]|uniref:hypothetical protein n=1 Tax=Kitasatospora sp. NPDC101235 TaxID=3364101 RepID=UPI0038148272
MTAVLLALLAGWLFWPEPDAPVMPVEQAQHRIEAELADVAGALHPGLQWTEARYGSDADTTGFCGTSGCEKTGRAELAAGQVARVRVSDDRRSETLDKVQAVWAGKGYAVTRTWYSLEVKEDRNPRFSLRFSVEQGGCARFAASQYDVKDTTGPDGSGGFAQGPKDSAGQCATVDDPYWSH